jgi:hypothetical protein
LLFFSLEVRGRSKHGGACYKVNKKKKNWEETLYFIAKDNFVVVLRKNLAI